ncbi:MAG: VanZ family protein [Niameybacter sp.]|nr:VanZ family protein [Niameybacter sp.]
MKKYIFLSFLLLIGTIGFIFSLSLQDAPTSNALSQEATRIIVSVMEVTPSPTPSIPPISNNMVRDLAHMGLFFILGCMSLLTCTLRRLGYIKSSLFTLLLGMITALCDELIQLNSIGRAFEWVDWGKDMLGITCSIALFSVAYSLLRLLRTKKALRTKF